MGLSSFLVEAYHWHEIEPRDHDHVSAAALLAVGRDLSAAEYRDLNASISQRRSFVEFSAGTYLLAGAAFQKWRHRVSHRSLNAGRASKVMSEIS
jgi:hypothetical protein